MIELAGGHHHGCTIHNDVYDSWGSRARAGAADEDVSADGVGIKTGRATADDKSTRRAEARRLLGSAHGSSRGRTHQC